VTNEDLSKLTYLAQAVVGQPSRLDEFVELIRADGFTGDLRSDQGELADALSRLTDAWKRFGDDPPSTSDVVALAGEFEQDASEAVRLLGIALSWAAENKLSLHRLEGKPLDPQDAKALDELSERASAPGF
jgi:hypothetical protein